MPIPVAQIASLVAFASLAAPFLIEAAWSKPKPTSTWLLCKCTCRATDAQGNHHYGSSDGVWYTTSRDACLAFPKCKVGTLTGIATNCSGYQKSGIQSR